MILFRDATMADIPEIQRVRNSVHENKLSNPGLVTDDDCADYLIKRGKGWVCEIQNVIAGFAIADLADHNIWALFVDPEFEKQGIGKKLHSIMMDWYFSKTKHTAWLNTAPHSRAGGFYKKAGWKETGIHCNNEIRFEMKYGNWKSNQNISDHPSKTDK